MAKRTKRIAFAIAGLGLLAVALLALGQLLVARAARDRCFDDPAPLPDHDVALVLGCSRLTGDGRRNLFFQYRIDAAARLFRDGKVRYLIVSGDNSRPGYDEPSDMKAELVQRGVPAERIYRDFAGLRTLDSVVRAREIFGVSKMVVVSQRFHAERAIYLAKASGMDADGFAADDVGGTHGLKALIRESFARVKAVLDVHLLRTQPRFGGSPIPIGPPEPNTDRL